MEKATSKKRFALFFLPLLCVMFLICNIADAANGRVVTVDGIGGLLTAIDPLYAPSTSSQYLYDSISSDWRIAFFDKIGPVQPFYWGGNLYTQTAAAVESLYNILKPISDSNRASHAPLVIISHSWGTVLTYIVLHEHPDIIVDKLITMGSPLNSIVPGVNTVTYPALVAYGILAVEQLPNIRVWNNYWAPCDMVSASISAASLNHECDISLFELGLCHSGYFEQYSEWVNILTDAINTQWPLEISYDPHYPKAPASINFSATGSLTAYAISYSWDFGDGQTASGQSVKYNYGQPDEYNVTLTMIDSDSATHVVTETVTVRQPPITVTYPNGYESLDRDFETPDISGEQSYVWNFGDGVIVTDDNHTTSHTYTTSGYYTVTLTQTMSDDSTVQSQTGIFVGPGTRYIQGHTIYADETWYSGGTYVVQGGIYVAQGATLTIEPGALIKFSNNGYLYVYGTLIADGTSSNKIVLTHITDDSYGGDTNGDGDATHPGLYWEDDILRQNLWYKIYCTSESSGSVLDNVIIINGGHWYNGGGTPVLSIESSSVTVSNCEIRDNFAAGIEVDDSMPTINYNVISNNGGNGIEITDASPVVTGNTITGINDSTGIYITGLSSLPQISGNAINNCGNAIYADNIVSTAGVGGDNVVAGNKVDGIFFKGSNYNDNGVLTVNATWHSNLMYVAYYAMSIPEGITLTIEPGTLVKFYSVNGYINVSGTLIADGTSSDKIVFTHITDDTYGGDTNGDGDATHPGIYTDAEDVLQHNIWYSLVLGPTSYNSVINNVVIKNGGYWYSLSGGGGPAPALSINSSSVTVSNCEISDNYSDGIGVEDSMPAINDNDISNNGGNGIEITDASPIVTGNTITGLNDSTGIYITGTSSIPQINGNTINNCGNAIYADNIVSTAGVDGDNAVTGNKVNGIFFKGSNYNDNGVLTVNATWHSNLMYVAYYAMSIPEGITLTIEPGTLVKFYSVNGYINVSGTLIADGTSSDKIVFTHITDDTYGGDTNGDGDATHPGIYTDANSVLQRNIWYSLILGSSSLNSVLDNVILKNGGYSTSGSSACLRINSSSVAISNCEISDNYAAGISVDDSMPTIIDNVISNNGGNGIGITDASPIASDNTITNNLYGLKILGDSYGSYQRNTISGNSTYGIYYNGFTVIDASDCDWGDPSGPLDTSDDRAAGGFYNPDGLGDKVSDQIHYAPWGIPQDSDCLLLDLMTDNYGDGIGWEIQNSADQVVAEGWGYPNDTRYITYLYLPDGDYIFTIYDYYEDGLCCANGNGYYMLTNTSTSEVLAQGDEFGFSESTSFSIGSKTYPNLINWNGNLVADFGYNGLWFHDGTSWNWMTNTGHVGQMVIWDSKLVVDFGEGGLYYYDGTWHWMTNKGNPNMMIAWDNGTSEVLVVDFGAGQRIYTYDGTWNWFKNMDGVADMTVWDNKLIVDFGNGRGLYNYDGIWNWMSNKDDVYLMLPWDNGISEVLVVDFGGGRRIYTYDGSWNWFINKDDVNDMTVWNQKLVVDFGGGRCLYNYDTSWHWMNNKDDVARMVTWRDAGTDLAVDFGSGRNMYNFDGSWTWMKNANDVPEMLAWNNRLVVDFGPGIGVYNYNGSWHLMKDWSTAD